jgi:hypothetical protein
MFIARAFEHGIVNAYLDMAAFQLIILWHEKQQNGYYPYPVPLATGSPTRLSRLYGTKSPLQSE